MEVASERLTSSIILLTNKFALGRITMDKSAVTQPTADSEEQDKPQHGSHGDAAGAHGRNLAFSREAAESDQDTDKKASGRENIRIPGSTAAATERIISERSIPAQEEARNDFR